MGGKAFKPRRKAPSFKPRRSEVRKAAWAVPLAGLLSLGIVLPVGLQGRWDVSVALVTIDGTVLTETKTVLVVGPAQLIAPQEARSKQQPATSVASLGTPDVPAPRSIVFASCHAADDLSFSSFRILAAASRIAIRAFR